MRSLTLFQLVLAVTLCGCGVGSSGPAKYKVTGNVTFDNEPVSEGVVTFYPTEKGIDADAGEIKEGKYSFLVKAGSKRVEIMASRLTGVEVIPGKIEREQYIPTKYNQQSVLTAEIETNGKNQIDFDLTTE